MFIMEHIRKARKKRVIRTQLTLIGLTAITLVIFAFYIKIAEWLGLLQLYVGTSLWGLTPLDTWLVIALLVFAVFFYVTYYLIYKFRVMKAIYA